MTSFRIESRANPRFKALRQLKSGFDLPSIAVEGEKLIRAALEAGLQPESIWSDTEQPFALDCPHFQLPAALFEQLKLTKTGLSPLAIFPAPLIPTTVPTEPLTGAWLLLDQVQDPGNAGALARAAAAFGFRGLLWHSPCVYPFHHACIRASAGAVFHLEHFRVDSNWIQSNQNPFIIANMQGEKLMDFRWPEHFVLVMGNEGHGFSEAIQSRKHCSVRVPTTSKVESLNVAGAAHIIMYAWILSLNPAFQSQV